MVMHKSLEEMGEAKSMDEKTLEALKGSIAKWEGIVAGTLLDKGHRNCPLCASFYPSCDDCPVKNRTGFSGCARTPYDNWSLHQGWHADALGRCHPDCSDCKRLATAELDFLKALLPAPPLHKTEAPAKENDDG